MSNQESTTKQIDGLLQRMRGAVVEAESAGVNMEMISLSAPIGYMLSFNACKMLLEKIEQLENKKL